MQIDPWGSSTYQDYARLREAFGIEAFGPEDVAVFRDPHPLLRRGVVFGHRDFGRVAAAVRGHDPWSVMTGFMPSGRLHLGHKMVLEQVVAHQKHGASVALALADFEAMAARNMTRQATQDLARREYVHNALALGLDGGDAPFYFQTGRRRVLDLAYLFAGRVNWSTLSALYGFSGETRLAHAMAPLVQAADILHVQMDQDGPRPVLVPVGVDQDPHIRLTRDIAQDWRTMNVQMTDQGVGVFVKPDEGVKGHLERAEAALRAEGYSDLKRHDAYKALYVRSATATDLRRIDVLMARIERHDNPHALLRPSATFHRFMTGLQGGKMSSSRPETSIYLTEEVKAAQDKLKRAVTGGRASAEEQRRIGAEPDKCPVYELYLYHVAESDAHLATVYDECKTGKRLCGSCKSEAGGLLANLLAGHKERRDEVEHLVDAAIAPSPAHNS